VLNKERNMKSNFDKAIDEVITILIFAVLAGLALVGYADLFQESTYTKAVLGFVTVFALTYRIIEKFYKKQY